MKFALAITPLLVAALVLTLALSGAAATDPPGHLVTYCHATPPDTAAQGYIEITSDVASVGYQHSGHQSEHDADIIPPYDYDDFSFAGKNWDTAGQEILRNGCVVPSPTPTPTPTPTEETPTPTETPVTCEFDCISVCTDASPDWDEETQSCSPTTPEPEFGVGGPIGFPDSGGPPPIH
jgi:hypothetical protein